MSGKLDPERRDLNSSLCSCKDCDSAVCFKKRRQSDLRAGHCSCERCVESKTCFFYTNKIVDLQESKSDMLKVQPKSIVESNKIAPKDKPKYVKEMYEKETIYDNDTNTKVMVQKRSKYSYIAPVSHVNKIGDSNKPENIAGKLCCEIPYSTVSKIKGESLNKTEIACYKATENKTADIEGKSAKHYSTEFDDNLRKTDKLNKMKPSSVLLETGQLNKTEANPDRPSTLVNNVALNYSQTDINSFAKKLSAQIMDVPYNDFKKTVSSHMSDNSIKPTDLTKLDIVNRIKEAYKACSCKVCECIANIPCQLTVARDDVCKCKPCDCDDCRKINKNQIKEEDSSKKYFDSANFCVCEPCNCIDCKMMAINPNRTIIVAPVGEETQRPVCQCTPCGCLECGNVFGTIATSLTHEMSTGVSRHRNCRCEACLNEACDQDITDSCRCEERDKVMRKPVQKDTNDYDIRSAIIFNNNPSPQGEGSKSARHNTVAMFAALTNNYQKPGPARGDTETCSCDDCECVVCKNSKGISPALKKSQNFGTLKKIPKSSNILNDCKCSPCECQICKLNKKNYVELNGRGNNCRCEVCDCINCANTIPACNEVHVNNSSSNKCSSQCTCDCVPCECLDCLKTRHKYTEDICHQPYLIENIHNKTEYLTKKEELLKVSMSNTVGSERYINHILPSNCDKSKSCFGKKSIHSYVSNSSEPEMFIYQTYPSYIDNSIRNEGRGEILDHFDDQCRRTLSYTKSKCYKCITYSDLKEDREARHLKHDKENIDCQVSETYISAVSSCATTSYIKHESGSISPISKKRTTRSSWQSSLNSSGHDHSDYLIRFPRTPAETCIHEVMKLNLDRKLNFNRINISSKANADNDSPRTYLNNRNENVPCCPKYYIEESCDHSKAIGCRKCKNLKPKSCGCGLCKCDRCLFSKLKITTCKCDCISCNCYGSCIGEDQLICIRKNEGTQTRLKLFQDRGQDSLDCENFSRDLFELNPYHYSIPYSKDYEMFRNGDCLYSHKHIDIPNKYCPYCRSQDSYIRNNVDFLSIPIHINYESVHNTIREARAFSLELLQILEKYERANREFESVSQKLKHADESPSNNGSPLENNKHNTQANVSNAEENEMKNEKQSNKYKNEEKQRLIQDMNPIKEEQNHLLGNNKEIADSKGIEARDLLETWSPKQSTEMPDIEPLSSYIFDEVCKQLFKDRQEIKSRNGYKKYKKLIKRTLSTAKRFNANNKTNVIASGTTTSENESTQVAVNEQKITVEAKDVEDPIRVKGDNSTKRYELIEDDKKLSIVLGNTTLNTLESFRRSEEQTIRFNLGNLDANRVYVDNEKSNEVQLQERKQIQENGNFAILKNLYLDNKTNIGTKGVTTKLPVLERDVKETVELISAQTRAVEETEAHKSCYGNNALTHMRVRVKNQMPQQLHIAIEDETIDIKKNLINAKTKEDLELKNASVVSLLQTNSKKEDTEHITKVSGFQKVHSTTTTRMKQQHHQIKDLTNYSSLNIPIKKGRANSIDVVADEHSLHAIASAKNSCDAMKISFTDVRRVSDHTVLVKWNPPGSTKDVQGYELLVDGRAVQKVLSPARCMAVVTCLPQTDKVIITIRMITTIGCSDRYPSTTIVYRPRAK